MSTWYDQEGRTWLADCCFCKRQLSFDGYRSEAAAARAVQYHLVTECPDLDDKDREAAASGPA